DAEADEEDQRQRSQDEHPQQGAVQQRRPDDLRREPGDHAGQSHADGHGIVDADHVGAQARIDRRAVGRDGRISAIEICHGGSLLYGAGRSARPETPKARLIPTWPSTESGCKAIVRFEPPNRTLAPTPTPAVTSPVAPT